MGWDLFFKKKGRNWAREGSSKTKQPKLSAPVGTPPKQKTSRSPGRPARQGSFTKPTLPFNIRLPVFTRGEIMGAAFIGDEERELALHGGSAERCALLRRTGLAGENIRDSDLEDGDEDREGRSGSRARRAAGAAHDTLAKTAASTSQMLAMTAAASQLSRMTRRKR